jgi:hypothetical protein
MLLGTTSRCGSISFGMCRLSGSEALLSSAVYERRDASAAGIELGKGTRYFAGGLYGGKSSRVVLMLEELVDYTNR